jgi:adenosylcobinamide kinase/adenosylcobinamide-phosphate guanylyltransferase
MGFRDFFVLMKTFILIVGGTRSGKSRYAVELAKKLGGKVVFIATATPCDGEMEERIKLHRLSRPSHWRLIEETKDISSVLPKLEGKYEVILVDCLGLLISNFMAEGWKDKKIERAIKKLIGTIQKTELATILVSNEVGSGIVPENPLARKFQDLIGFTNQMAAEKADEVILMQSGIPIRIKDSGLRT